MAQQFDENGIPLGNLMDGGNTGISGGMFNSQTPLGFQQRMPALPYGSPGANTGITGGVGVTGYQMPQQVLPQKPMGGSGPEVGGFTGLPNQPGQQPQQTDGGLTPNPNWVTKGFSAPQWAPQTFNAGNLFGTLDQTKLNDLNYQDPKYALLRGLSNFESTPAGLQQALPTIQRMYPGTVQVGKDKLQVPGVGLIDVGPAFGAGGGLGWGYNLITGPNGESATPAPAPGAPIVGQNGNTGVTGGVGVLGNGMPQQTGQQAPMNASTFGNQRSLAALMGQNPLFAQGMR